MRTILICLTLALLLEACAAGRPAPEPVAEPDPGPPVPEAEVVAAPYHGQALYNYAVARSYMAEGRYVLAREHLLLALSSTVRDDLRRRVARDLEAVDQSIKSQR
jgi:hypothetical protein